MPNDYADHVARWTVTPADFVMAPESVIDPGHVWVVYTNGDNTAYSAISIHMTAEEAAREAARTGYAHAAKWPLGMELTDAIKEWVGR